MDRNLCIRDVVVVSINYRLGAFGFFATTSGEANFGLWDQTLALRWVRRSPHSTSVQDSRQYRRIWRRSIEDDRFRTECWRLLHRPPPAEPTLQRSPVYYHTETDFFQHAIAMSGSAECSQACQSRDLISRRSRHFARIHGYKGSGKGRNTSSCIR